MGLCVFFGYFGVRSCMYTLSLDVYSGTRGGVSTRASPVRAAAMLSFSQVSQWRWSSQTSCCKTRTTHMPRPFAHCSVALAAFHGEKAHIRPKVLCTIQLHDDLEPVREREMKVEARSCNGSRPGTLLRHKVVALGAGDTRVGVAANHVEREKKVPCRGTLTKYRCATQKDVAPPAAAAGVCMHARALPTHQR